MTYDVDFFWGKFSKIPFGKWLVGSFGRGEEHCANGHCGVKTNSTHIINDEADQLNKLFGNLRIKIIVESVEYHKKWWGMAAVINDGLVEEYQQPHPKLRILAALNDVKKLQEQPPPPTPPQEKQKTIIRYVSVPQTLTEQSKELILQ